MSNSENSEISRRKFLGSVLATGTCVIVAGSISAWGQKARALESALKEPLISSEADADPDAQYGFLVNVRKCINCGKCVDACRLWSRTPKSAPSRREVISYTDRIGRELFLSLSCMHCKNPSCLEVCPAGAISKGTGGIVTVDKDICIGCKYCYQACPFEVPQYNSVSMDKCDYCFGAGIPLGDPPRCVRACKVDALLYGKLNDLLARSSKARKVGGVTDPSYVFV
jgi:Fe-S-cluster-containing dehydrogenase component